MRDDPALPGVAELLDDRALAILAPAVAGSGGTLLRLRPNQVRYDPGRRLVVRYDADVEWGDGTRRAETLGALLQPGSLPGGLAVVHRGDGVRVGAWRYPHDPFLPGLPHAAYPEGARQILAALGVDVDEVTVEPLVYRPASRAVVRVRADGLELFIKVLPPDAAQALADLHAAFAPHVRVPRCLGWSAELGVVALEPLAGVPLTRALVDGGALPPPADLAALVGALRGVEASVPAGRSTARIPAFAELLSAALPEEAERITALLGRAKDLGGAEEVVVHGDLYDGQILTRDGMITGLLDIDGVRRGSRLDDPATLLGHLVALAHVHAAAARRIHGYRRELESALVAPGEGDDLRDAVLGVLLGLATTSFRRQERRWEERTRAWIRLCEAWADGDESFLMTGSSSAHGARTP